MFEVEWRGRRVALKANNGRYVCMKKNGQLAAISDFVGECSPPSPGGWGWALCPGTVPGAAPHPQGAALSLAEAVLAGQDQGRGGGWSR